MVSARRRGRELPIDLLRWFLLAALVLFLIAMGTIYFRGRQQKGPPVPVPSREPVAEPAQTVVLSGRGFDFELTQAGRKIFHIKADRVLSRQEDEYTLEGVELDVVRDGGAEYHIRGQSGNYNSNTQQANIQGDVVFRGPSNLELRTEGLELRRSGKLLVSTGPVDFLFMGRFSGRADRMRINVRSDTFHLIDRVEVDTLPGDNAPMSLRCRRLIYERATRIVRSEGDVVMRRHGDELRARRVALKLSEDEESARFVRAYWQVAGDRLQETSEGITSSLHFEARELSVLFEETDNLPLEAELQGADDTRAVLAWSDGAGLTRRIRADYLVGEFELGELRRVEAIDRVEIDEYVTFAEEVPLRRICSETADATLGADGSLAEALFDGGVDLQEDALQAHGDQMLADESAGSVELLGDPAWLLNERGRLESPRIVYSREDGRIRATDGVRALVQSEGQIALGSSASGEPIRIQAEEAEWSSSPSTVYFRDQVRAWQGENFLLADELLGDVEQARLTASGSVRTVWRPEPEASSLEPSDDGQQEGEPLEVTAQKLVYERDEGLMTYSGGSRAHQAGRIIRCTEIRLREGDSEGFDELLCEGAARLEDPEKGKTVTGDRVLYIPNSSTARIVGRPVVMRDVNGTEIRGRILIYNFDSGTAEIQIETVPDISSQELQDTPP